MILIYYFEVGNRCFCHRMGNSSKKEKNMSVKPVVCAFFSVGIAVAATAKLDFGSFTKPTGGGSRPQSSETASEAESTPKGDATVRAMLDAEKIKYSVNDSGNFLVTWRVGDSGRTQLAVINSATESYEGFAIRQIWSVAYKGTRLPRNAMAQLLIDNGAKKIGAWELATNERNNSEWVVFTIKVPANLPAKQLRAMSSVVAEVADEMEEKLDGGDDL